MAQETILETLKNICLNCLANEPSDPTEREIGYSAAMEHIVKIIDKQTNKVEKQTAVEWLINQLKQYDFADIKDQENYIIKIQSWVLTEKVEQAREMEEQQMLEFWNGGIDCTEGGVCFDQYYNETYKKE